MGHWPFSGGVRPFQAIASIPAKNLMKKEEIGFSLSSRNPHKQLWS
jgi:hypothetical protein